MPRTKKPRYIGFRPKITQFNPQSSLKLKDNLNLTVDELEAIRLADFVGLDQIKAAGRMKISQSTFQRILKEAHKKIAEALVKGKAINVKGGEFIMAAGRGRGMRRGRGRMAGPYAAGPGGFCFCTNPECKNEIPHQVGVPCYQTKCSKCGSPMVRKR